MIFFKINFFLFFLEINAVYTAWKRNSIYPHLTKERRAILRFHLLCNLEFYEDYLNHNYSKEFVNWLLWDPLKIPENIILN